MCDPPVHSCFSLSRSLVNGVYVNYLSSVIDVVFVAVMTFVVAEENDPSVVQLKQTDILEVWY